MVSRETLFQRYFPTPIQEKQIQRYAQLLEMEGIEWGLIGPREGDRIWDRHISNSLPITNYLQNHESVLDVGSGAGLPGVVIAIAKPEVKVTLLEPLERRVEFLELVKNELDLEVQIIRGRAQEHKGVYSTVTSRAVANLSDFFKISKHLVASKGRILALKGEKAPLEISEWELKNQKYMKNWSSELIISNEPELGTNLLVELKHLI
jgi:16S rRNA (guanine527-N7)-methyltransferase